MPDAGYPQTATVSQRGAANYYFHSGGSFYHEIAGGYSSLWRSKTSQDTPGWPVVQRQNPYFIAEFLRRDTMSSYHTHFDNGDEDLGTIPISVFAGGWEPGEDTELLAASGRVTNKLIVKLVDAVRDQKVNLGVAFGERRQTANLVASSINRIATAVRQVKRGRLSAAAKTLTGSSSVPRKGARGLSVPQQWLELQYGWKPLLSDVHSSCEELRRHLVNGSPEYVAVRVGAGEELRQEISLGPYAEAWPKVNLKKSGSVRGSARVWYEVRNNFAHDLASTGITDPLVLAWELVPWSFVVDWFYPVGRFLESCGYHNGLRFVAGSYSIRSRVNWHGGIQAGTRRGTGYSQTQSGGSITTNFNGFSRGVWSSWPQPELPHWKDPLSLTHVANALSLLATAFSSGRKIR